METEVRGLLLQVIYLSVERLAGGNTQLLLYLSLPYMLCKAVIQFSPSAVVWEFLVVHIQATIWCCQILSSFANRMDVTLRSRELNLLFLDCCWSWTSFLCSLIIFVVHLLWKIIFYCHFSYLTVLFLLICKGVPFLSPSIHPFIFWLLILCW